MRRFGGKVGPQDTPGARRHRCAPSPHGSAARPGSHMPQPLYPAGGPRSHRCEATPGRPLGAAGCRWLPSAECRRAAGRQEASGVRVATTALGNSLPAPRLGGRGHAVRPTSRLQFGHPSAIRSDLRSAGRGRSLGRVVTLPAAERRAFSVPCAPVADRQPCAAAAARTDDSGTAAWDRCPAYAGPMRLVRHGRVVPMPAVRDSTARPMRWVPFPKVLHR